MVAIPPNITPDEETGIGSWSDAQIKTAIREGIRPDGRVLGPPMPFPLYRDISDEDITAIVAYLRTVPPVTNKTEPSAYEFPLPPNWGPPPGFVPEPDRENPVEYGAYLAGPLGHCVKCHSTPGANGEPDMENALGAGGLLLHGPMGRVGIGEHHACGTGWKERCRDQAGNHDWRSCQWVKVDAADGV